jgi:hypothetical protein
MHEVCQTWKKTTGTRIVFYNCVLAVDNPYALKEILARKIPRIMADMVFASLAEAMS